MSQSSHNSNSQSAVCHSGNAHVRGKIRRVWRPRYLELLENGLVRYYDEVPKIIIQPDCPTGRGIGSRKQQQQEQIEAAKVIKMTPPKCTLVVVPGSTRILDVTTLRDMHIGLPRGSYGFVFRGQKLITAGDSNAGAEIRQNQVSSAESDFVGEEDGIPTLLSPSGSMSSLQHLSVGCYPNALVAAEPRDFLCAVATLEEAQMWVVALQWAALPASARSSASANNAIPWWASRASSTTASVENVRTRPTSAGRPISPPSLAYSVPNTKGSKTNLNITTTDMPSDNKIGNIQHSSSTSAFYYTSLSDNTPAGLENEQSTGFINRTLTSKSSSMSTQEVSNVTIPTSSNYIVSKVIKYRTVRTISNDSVGSSWKFEIAYEIHGLLIHYNSPDSLSQQQEQASDCNMIGEHWSMLRTASDFQVLIQNLCKELGPSLLDRAQLGPIKQLPRWHNKPSPTELYNSLSIVDSILRSLVMDAAMVNAQSMKAFLGLLQTSDGNDQKQQRSNIWFVALWNLHDPESVLTRSFETIPSDVVLEHYVKQWLLRKTEISSRQRTDVTTSLMQRPQWIVGGIGFTSIVIVPWASYIGGKYNMPTITIRFDFLVASWVGAAYIGNKYLGALFNTVNDTSTKTIDNATKRSDSFAVNKSRNKHVISPNVKLRPKIQPREESYDRKSKVDRLQQKSDQLESGKPSVSILPSTAKEEDESMSLETEGEDDDGFILPSQSYKGGGKIVDERNLDDGGSSSSDEENDDDEGANVGAVGGEYLSSVSQAMYTNQIQSNTSPLTQYDYGSDDIQTTCWSQPISGSGQVDNNQGKNHVTFYVRGSTYLQDRIKIPSGPPALHCRGIDIWLTDNPERHIARHPAMLGGRLHEEDTFLVNFLLPFGNFVAYFSIPPLSEFPNEKLRNVWSKFLKGDQQYRDARLKLLPVVVEGPWIVKTAVGPGKSPALLGKVIPLQYFFRDPDVKNNKKGVYEVDVIITASTIAKGILSVVKGHTKSVSLAFAFIIEASEQEELPETVLCSCQIHSVHLEHCPILPPYNLDEIEM